MATFNRSTVLQPACLTAFSKKPRIKKVLKRTETFRFFLILVMNKNIVGAHRST